MKRFINGVAMCAILTGVTAAPLYAQETPTKKSEEAGTITVTAQRREQSAQDVGIALSVVSSEELKARGITRINDLQEAVPALQIEPAFGGGQPQFRLRGVGFQDYASNNAPTVGVYVNQIAYPVPIMTQGLIFDVSRVEVLRGPQGTLYGRNTTGGAINFITNQPTDDFHVGSSFEYGRFHAFTGEAYVSGPITDGVTFRVAGAAQMGGAYQHNRDTGESLGDADRIGTRALLKIAPSGTRLTVLLDGHYGRDKSEATGLYLLNSLTQADGAGTIPADTDRFATGWGVSPQLVADTDLKSNSKPGVNNRTWGTSANVSYDFGGVTLASITAYDWLHREQFADWDSSASIEADTYFRSIVKVFAEEVQLRNSNPGPLTWVAGLYYSKQNLDEQYFSDFIDLYGTYARVTYAQKVESISGYGQAEYQIAPRLKATAGLRYEYEKRTLDGFGSAFGGATALPPTTVDTSMKPLTGKVELQYEPSRDLMLYVSASKGVKSGGFTTYNTGSESGISPFAPEKLYAYEAGFKSEPFPWMRFNASAYYYDYRDQQVLSAIWSTTTNSAVGHFVNAPKSRVLGGEVELDLEPVKGLTINQYLGYTEGKYIEFYDLDVAASRAALAAVYTDKSHQAIPFPKLTWGGSVAYEVPAGDYVVTPSASFSYRSKYPSWLGSTYDIGAYFVVNANLTLAPKDERWSVSVWGRNIFNEAYDLTRNFFTSADIAQPARPVSYGVRFGIKY
ncbi:TonB-dependent receptor [Novosphingobium sp. 1949]|uniref:TonB-dependent receptor n=1 Tax=Novosphingobium organovorum TaxID=2930092 RepID=A0ABT0BHC7_9SPHN|nr:TonB-dependent receptor [Novosphingobium organovorum]MCJ2184248.1 TonB-dependent receptor [Novosphingobium organovorum]